MIDEKALEAAMQAAQDADIDPYGTDWAVVIPAAIEAYKLAERQPEETAPKGVFVLVPGGMAKKHTGGDWYSYNGRKIEWEVPWWLPLPPKGAKDE